MRQHIPAGCACLLYGAPAAPVQIFRPLASPGPEAAPRAMWSGLILSGSGAARPGPAAGGCPCQVMTASGGTLQYPEPVISVQTRAPGVSEGSRPGARRGMTAQIRGHSEVVTPTGIAEEERRVLAVIQEMLDAQEVGNVGQVLATLSSRPEAAHMATDGTKWETSWEAAHAVTAVPGDGLRLVADHFDIHLQGGVAWAEGRGRISNQSGAERPVRMSCVLIREGGQWVIVQSHASLPVRDAEIFQLETGC